ncbi:entericidin [Oceaniglobus ichthyenteri]|nr:entericidin [Oceaniglobus ichthyenteri]
MKNTVVILMISVLGLSACNTAVGAAKDVYGGTKYVAKKVVGSDKDNE